MRSLHPSKFCCYFSLRQGTICIAITELTLTIFVLLIVTLMANEFRVVERIRTQIIREERVDYVEERDDSDDYYYDSGEKGVKRTKESDNPALDQLFQVIMYGVCAGMVLSTTHLLLCLLLLFGAIRRIPRLLLPWLSTTMVSMLVWVVGAMLIVVEMPTHRLEMFIVAVTLLAIEAHSWLIVYGHFRQLSALEVCRQANNILPSFNFGSKFSTVDI